ncbi:MAG: molecular chaperone TorD family protein [Planctomycetes bacterium]|nr:molecular chaperone TorD family protein [Planctomycetota bacterium]
MTAAEQARGAAGAEVASLLEEVSRLRALAVLFGPPGPDLAAELRGLAASVHGRAAAKLLELAEAVPATIEEEHNRLLGPGGPCPRAESDYEAACLAGKGPLIADVAAFYKAFAFEGARELREAPDHVAAELSFAAYLLVKEAYAVAAGRADAAGVCRDALGKFRAEHLGRALPAFLARLEAAAGDGFYGQAVQAARVIATKEGAITAVGLAGALAGEPRAGA